MVKNLNEECFLNFPTIETDRLILREARDEDASLIFSIRSNPKALEFLDSTPHKSHSDGAAHLKKNAMYLVYTALKPMSIPKMKIP